MKNRSIYYIAIITWSILPLAWQIYTSFSSPEALTAPILNHNNRWTLENYIQIINSDPPFWTYLANSTLVGLLTTFITLLVAIPASYALTKISFYLSSIIRLILLGAALFPYVLLFLALLEFARKLDLGNNLLALSLPYSALSMPLAILLLSSSFRDLPKDLEEAATLEGLTLLDRFRFILIPLIRPAVASTGILVFLFTWNEYPIALTWISNENMLTLPVAMARIAGSSIYSVPYGAYAAATVLGSLPLLLFVIIFQKQIVSGLTQGAVKG